MQELHTNKANFAHSNISNLSDQQPLTAGQVRLTIERFGFTANNITYAVMGDKIKYWDFFPAKDVDTDNWGIIPVWGFAVVSESKHDEMPVGARYFGYLPPANELIVQADKISPHGFVDISPHRSHLPPTYNGYRRMGDQFNVGDNEFMLLYPLHITAFAIRLMLQSNNYYDAKQVIITSASSKTGSGLAYALEQDESAPAIIGLTSGKNVDTVKAINTYQQVFDYDSVTDIDASKATVIVDMAANGELLGRLHQHLGDNMRFTSNVGLTHWGEAGPNPHIIRERSDMFFAPTHINNYVKQHGTDAFNTTTTEYLGYTITRSKEWLTMTDVDGLAGLQEVYPAVCDGSLAANLGLVVVM